MSSARGEAGGRAWPRCYTVVVLLSAFFVGYLLLMAVTGALANRYGGWLVLGVAVLWWSAWTALTPPAAAHGGDITRG